MVRKRQLRKRELALQESEFEVLHRRYEEEKQERLRKEVIEGKRYEEGKQKRERKEARERKRYEEERRYRQEEKVAMEEREARKRQALAAERERWKRIWLDERESTG